MVLADNDQGWNTHTFTYVSSKRIKRLRELLRAQSNEVATWKNDSNIIGKYTSSLYTLKTILFRRMKPMNDWSAHQMSSNWSYNGKPNQAFGEY